MPVDDLTGATRNFIGAQQAMGDVNAQRKQALGGGIAGIGKAAGEAYQFKQLADILTQNGLDPSLARDPHAATQAVLEKRKQDILRQRQTAGVAEANKAMTPQTSFDPATAATGAQEGFAKGLAGGGGDPLAGMAGAASGAAGTAQTKTPDFASALRGVSTPEGEEALRERYKTMSDEQRANALAMRPQTDVERAQIGAGSREKVAQIGATSRENTAGIRADASTQNADTRARAALQAAGLDPDDPQNVNALGAIKQRLAGAAEQRADTGAAAQTETARHHGATEANAAGALDQRKAEFENRKAEFGQRLDRIDQRIAMEQSSADKKIDPAVMQRIVNARQKARDAAAQFDSAGADAAMKEAESLIPAAAGGKLKATGSGAHPSGLPPAQAAALEAKGFVWNGTGWVPPGGAQGK